MKKIIKSIWFWFLLPVLVTVVGGLILSKLENVDIFKGMLNFLKWIYNGIIFILTINIPLWVLLLIGIFLFIILSIISKIIDNNHINVKRWYEDYTDDIYKGVRYGWSYSELGNEINPENFRPVCNKCKGELIKKKSHGNIHYGTAKNYCPNCDEILETPTYEELDTAFVYIINKLTKKYDEFKKQINNKNKC